eukprot:gb/GECG01009784.1/.p1 GENE.gb/GECG01009784.1/~~gb/GECG01009784.1/.p1  ORF type:complete len:170 (+),score=11.73 gb/GECG01009784.1/:1-510(+)
MNKRTLPVMCTGSANCLVPLRGDDCKFSNELIMSFRELCVPFLKLNIHSFNKQDRTQCFSSGSLTAFVRTILLFKRYWATVLVPFKSWIHIRTHSRCAQLTEESKHPIPTSKTLSIASILLLPRSLLVLLHPAVVLPSSSESHSSEYHAHKCDTDEERWLILRFSSIDD